MSKKNTEYKRWRRFQEQKNNVDRGEGAGQK